MLLLFLTQKRMCEFECDPDAGKMLIGIFAIGLVRIYDRIGVRITTFRIRDVMIGDDKVDTVFFRPGDRLKTSYPSVDADGDFATIGFCFLTPEC